MYQTRAPPSLNRILTNSGRLVKECICEALRECDAGSVAGVGLSGHGPSLVPVRPWRERSRQHNHMDGPETANGARLPRQSRRLREVRLLRQPPSG